MNEILAAWEDHGIREFLILTAHRHELHLDALLMAMTSSANTIVVNILAMEVDDLLEASPLTELGGEMETSLMLYLAPHLVTLDQASDVPPLKSTHRRYARGWTATPPPESKGILGFPTRATAEKGRALFNRYVKSLTEVLGEEEGEETAIEAPTSLASGEGEEEEAQTPDEEGEETPSLTSEEDTTQTDIPPEKRGEVK